MNKTSKITTMIIGTLLLVLFVMWLLPDNHKCADPKIKGNINARGEKIYHVPGGQYYDRTGITAEKGELYFCTEDGAKSAGFRKSVI